MRSLLRDESDDGGYLYHQCPDSKAGSGWRDFRKKRGVVLKIYDAKGLFIGVVEKESVSVLCVHLFNTLINLHTNV